MALHRNVTLKPGQMLHVTAPHCAVRIDADMKMVTGVLADVVTVRAYTTTPQRYMPEIGPPQPLEVMIHVKPKE